MRWGGLLAQHLLDKGLRHVAFFRRSDLAYDTLCQEGFCERVKEAGLEPIVIEPLDPHVLTWEADDHAFFDVLRRLPRPIGIATNSDADAKRISDVCAVHRLSIPEEIALIGVGNEQLTCEMCVPSLSTVALPTEQIGFLAAELLDCALRGGKPPQRPWLVAPLGVVERGSTDTRAAVHDPLIARALAFLESHAADDIRVNDLLQHLLVSRKTLEVRFRQALGRTPRQEIERMRLAEAKRLLSQTTLTMSEIASRCGFSSAVYFSAVFSKAVGEPPMHYRKRHR